MKGKILCMDYKQLEMRLLASEAGDENMLQIFRERRDIHDETAESIFGKKFTKGQRDIAKNINFGTVYGISDYSLAAQFNLSKEMASDLLKKHREAYLKIYKWMELLHKLTIEKEVIQSRFGQIRRFPGLKAKAEICKAEEFGGYVSWQDKMDLAGMLRQAGNFPIQSQGAHICNQAGVEINKYFMTHGFKSLYFHQVHDSVLIDCHPEERGEYIAEVCENIMTRVIPARAPWLKVELPVDYKLSFRWGGGE